MRTRGRARALAAAAALVTLVGPGGAGAKIDTTCDPIRMTSAIPGDVTNALGEPLAGMTVEIYTSGRSTPAQPAVTTDERGRYVICAGRENAAGHDTYDVHVKDLRAARLYAAENQPYTTYTNLTDDADFTVESGRPLLFLTALTVTPSAISTAAGDVDVSWIVRSKAPATTVMKLALGHRTDPTDARGEFTMAFQGAESGGPDAGGWNRWIYEERFRESSQELLYFADAYGLQGQTVVTQRDRQPYTVDNTPPRFGYQPAAICGPGIQANPFRPGEPGTTNPRPLVFYGVCDFHSEGARSGLDPFSLRGWLCSDPGAQTACTEINPALDTFTIVWLPPARLALGSHFLRFEIADDAGNVAMSNPQPLTIIERGGQTPTITGITPGNLGNGNNVGVVIGSTATTPTAYPSIGFRATDADGQLDIVPGSLRVRVYYGDERALVYDYDPSMPETAYDAVSKRGGGYFNLDSGTFRAHGFPLQGKPAGRYMASAVVNDHGTNSATMSWHWILVGAH